MKVVILIVLILAASQVSASPSEQVISVQHDSHRGVTCWIVNNSGISCLPDSSLPESAAPSKEAGRAAPASSVSENGPSMAAPLPQAERVQL